MVWFMPMWFADDWWQIDDTDCTPKQILEAADGAFYCGVSPINPLDTTGLAGVNNTQLFRMFVERSGGMDISDSKASLSYDAMWTTSMVLNKTVQKLQELGFSLFQQLNTLYAGT